MPCSMRQQVKQRLKLCRASHRLCCGLNGNCTRTRLVPLLPTPSVEQEVEPRFAPQKYNNATHSMECRARTAIRPSCVCYTAHNEYLVCQRCAPARVLCCRGDVLVEARRRQRENVLNVKQNMKHPYNVALAIKWLLLLPRLFRRLSTMS